MLSRCLGPELPSCRYPVTVCQTTYNLGPGRWAATVPSPWAIPVSGLFGNWLAPGPWPDPPFFPRRWTRLSPSAVALEGQSWLPHLPPPSLAVGRGLTQAQPALGGNTVGPGPCLPSPQAVLGRDPAGSSWGVRPAGRDLWAAMGERLPVSGHLASPSPRHCPQPDLGVPEAPRAPAVDTAPRSWPGARRGRGEQRDPARGRRPCFLGVQRRRVGAQPTARPASPTPPVVLTVLSGQIRATGPQHLFVRARGSPASSPPRGGEPEGVDREARAGLPLRAHFPLAAVPAGPGSRISYGGRQWPEVLQAPRQCPRPRPPPPLPLESRFHTFHQTGASKIRLYFGF